MRKLFGMSKTMTLVWLGGCIVAIIAFYSIPNLSLCAGPFVVWAIVFGCSYTYKLVRDQSIVRASRLSYHSGPLLPPPPPMSSTGSDRLFIPPPLERR